MKLKKMLLYTVLAASFAAALFCGAEQLSVPDIFCTHDSFSRTIFFSLRLPRALLCLFSGALLAGAGASFQLFFRNPLAEPGILGLSSGATLGAVLAASCISKGTDFLSVHMGAFCGALCSGLIVTLLAGKKSHSTVVILLCGTALGTLYSAFSSIMLSRQSERLYAMYTWMLGSFSGRGWAELAFILPPFLGTVLLLFLGSPQLDLLSCGEITAQSLGASVTHLRLLVLAAGSLATSAAVSAGGTIGFIGLIAPHIIRKCFGVKSAPVIFLSMAGGAALMLLSDTIARTVCAPAELPVGTVTALLGAPFFISLLFTEKGVQNG